MNAGLQIAVPFAITRRRLAFCYALCFFLSRPRHGLEPKGHPDGSGKKGAATLQRIAPREMPRKRLRHFIEQVLLHVFLP